MRLLSRPRGHDGVLAVGLSGFGLGEVAIVLVANTSQRVQVILLLLLSMDMGSKTAGRALLIIAGKDAEKNKNTSAECCCAVQGSSS